MEIKVQSQQGVGRVFSFQMDFKKPKQEKINTHQANIIKSKKAMILNPSYLYSLSTQSILNRIMI